jgi:transcriptional regulator GlxA family with amidase domain
MTDGDIVDLVTSAVTASPAGDYRATRLSELAGVSFRHLSRLFISRIGISPAEYVEQVRFRVACRALKDHAALTLPEVAGAAGFGSAETMRRVFVRRLGTTPGAYRSDPGHR